MRRQRGFSTIEVLVSSMVAAITLATVVSFSRTQANMLAAQSVHASVQDVTRTAIDMMTRELRMASYDPSNTALPLWLGLGCPGVRQGILEAGPAVLHFRQDLNGDGYLVGAGEDVRYDHVGTEVRRRDGANAPAVLLQGVQTGGLAFRYFDARGSELVPAGVPPRLGSSQLPCVSRVRVLVRATQRHPNPTVATPLASTATSDISIRHRSLLNF